METKNLHNNMFPKNYLRLIRNHPLIARILLDQTLPTMTELVRLEHLCPQHLDVPILVVSRHATSQCELPAKQAEPKQMPL